MTWTGEDRRRTGSGERHYQTVVQTVIAAVLSGIILGAPSVISGINDKLSDLKSHNSGQDEKFANLQELVKSMYRAEDARRDNAETARQIEDLKRRMTVLEANVAGRQQSRELQQWQRKQ